MLPSAQIKLGASQLNGLIGSCTDPGHYDVSCKGGTCTVNSNPPTDYSPNTSTSAPGAWGGGAYTYFTSSGGSITCADRITAHFAWNLGPNTAPAPAAGTVIVTETANAYWSGPGGKEDCGLPNPTTPAIAAYAFWLIACELALLRNIRLTLEVAPDRRTGQVAVALWLLSAPYYLELFVGQFTFITASLVFWAYLGWQTQERRPPPEPPRGKARRAVRKAGGRRAEGQWTGGRWVDGFWAAAVWLKMMPLLFLPVVLLRGRWKGALAAGMALALSSVTYFSSFPQDWAVFAATNAVEAPAGHAGNLGLMAFLYHAAGERQVAYRLERAAVLLLVGSGLAWLTYQAWQSLRARVGDGESRMLRLYAGCSAAYLLAYKDVWEHHYVLLLPPLVLLALRRENPWLWLPPFLISALPGLFALYDVPSIGYNEDPQVYWRPATSLLHHGGKPLAPLWLMAGLLIQSRARINQAAPRRARSASLAALGACGLAFGGGLFWARGVVAAQQRVTRDLVWPASVFQKQQTTQTCGPAALAAVCRHFGMAATEGEVARLAGTTAAGTSMLGLQTAARAKGLAAEGLRVTPGGLSRTPMPCILFF